MSIQAQPDLFAQVRPIPGYEGRYFISTDGRVFSCLGRGGRRGVADLRSMRELSGTVNSKGYAMVSLRSQKGDRGRPIGVHRLVLLAFVGPPPEGMETCHNNGISTDNRVENLRWDSHSSNLKDKTRHGTNWNNRGELHPLAKLTRSDADNIRAKLASGATRREVAKEFGVAISRIGAIARGAAWCDEPVPSNRERAPLVRGADAKRTLGYRLRALREAASWTKKRLTDMLGIHPLTISHYEAGRASPSIQMARRIVALLGADLSALSGARVEE